MVNAFFPGQAVPQSTASSANADRVADAPADNWVYGILPRWLWPYAQLARWDRPIGWWLLLWPCWWSVAMAAPKYLAGARTGDLPSPWLIFVAVLILFWLGAVAMRGAGCTYNDIVDVKIDEQVSRTASRPIPSGRVTHRQAVLFMGLQLVAGLLVLLALCATPLLVFNIFALILALAAMAIVLCYPFAKRVTDWPQFVLGLAFSWGALMGWAVLLREVTLAPLLLYAGSVFWVIGYDTIYAHQDREDDALVGVRSTARLFGKRTKPALLALYWLTLLLMTFAFQQAGVGLAAYAGLMAAGIHMVMQIMRLNIDDGDKCLALFKSNSTLGWLILAGLVADVAIKSV